MDDAHPKTARPTRGTHLAGVDGLRALACTMVLVGHVLWIGGDTQVSLGRFDPIGWALAPAGLMLFFVLSGFLLYRPFAAAIVLGYTPPATGRFLRNRALRIGPAYVVILLLVALVLGVAVTDIEQLLISDETQALNTTGEGVGRITDPVLLLQNLVLLQNYAPSSMMTGIGPAWSLAIEVVFYLSLPPLAFVAARLARGRGMRGRTLAGLAPAALLLAIGLSSKVVAALTLNGSTDPRQQWGQTWHAVFERSFLPWADMFAYGMAAAVLATLAGAGRLPRLKPAHISRSTALGVLILVAALGTVPIHERVLVTVLGVLLTGLVLTVALPARPTRLSAALDWRPIAFVGVVSYSVYLWHMPVITMLRLHDLSLNGRIGFLVMAPTVFALTLAASALTYRYVEAPAMRRKLRVTRDGALPASVSGPADPVQPQRRFARAADPSTQAGAPPQDAPRATR